MSVGFSGRAQPASFEQGVPSPNASPESRTLHANHKTMRRLMADIRTYLDFMELAREPVECKVADPFGSPTVGEWGNYWARWRWGLL